MSKQNTPAERGFHTIMMAKETKDELVKIQKQIEKEQGLKVGLGQVVAVLLKERASRKGGE